MHSASPIEPICSQFAVSEFGLATIRSRSSAGSSPELLGDLVELHFLAEARLRRAVAALGSARRLVGEDAACLEAVAGQLVGHRLQCAGVEGARDAVRPVAAAVDQRLQMHPCELAVIHHAGAESHQHRMPAAVHVEDFLAREADLHRAAEHQRRFRDHRLVIAHVALAAEAATVRRRDHAQVRGRDAQHAGEHAMHVVRNLSARPQRELAIGIQRRDRGVLLDREMGVALEEEEILEDVVGPGERLPDVAELERLEAMDVPPLAVVVDPRLGAGERLLGRGDGRERRVLHVDQVERLERRQLVLRDHRRDRVADIADVLGRERIFVLRHREDAEGDREVLAGQHELHAGVGGGARRVDRRNQRVRQTGAQQLAVEHPRERDVVGEARLPGDLRPAVDSPARLADDREPALRAHFRSSRRRSAAASTPSKICR